MQYEIMISLMIVDKNNQFISKIQTIRYLFIILYVLTSLWVETNF